MRVATYLSFLMIAVLLAWFRGAAPERRAAVAILLTLVVQQLARYIYPANFQTVDLVALSIDLSLLIYFTALSLSANRIWPLWAAAAQLISMSGHFFRATQFDLNVVVYGIITRFPTWIIVFSLILGTFRHTYFIRRYGRYPNWLSEF
jgi:hypothetical protein